MFGWRLVFISRADSEHHCCSNTDAICLSDGYQLSRHFRTILSAFSAEQVFTVYTLTLVQGPTLKYAALAYDVQLYIL